MLRLRSLISLGLCFSLTGCAATVHNWDKGPPAYSSKMTPAERQDAFNQYAIQDIQSQGSQVAFTTAEDPDYWYSLDSYAYVLNHISSDTEEHLEQARQFAFIQDIWGYSMVASLILPGASSWMGGNANFSPQVQQTLSVIGWSVFVASLVGTSVFAGLEQYQYQELKKDYLKDLNQYLYHDTAPISQIWSQPTFSFGTGFGTATSK